MLSVFEMPNTLLELNNETFYIRTSDDKETRTKQTTERHIQP